MPISLADLDFAASLTEMSDEDFLLAWHEEVVANDEPRIILVESAATHRFGLSTWHHRYALRFPARCAIAFPQVSGHPGERLSVTDHRVSGTGGPPPNRAGGMGALIRCLQRPTDIADTQSISMRRPDEGNRGV
jgi:hypothetical protein